MVLLLKYPPSLLALARMSESTVGLVKSIFDYQVKSVCNADCVTEPQYLATGYHISSTIGSKACYIMGSFEGGRL